MQDGPTPHTVTPLTDGTSATVEVVPTSVETLIWCALTQAQASGLVRIYGDTRAGHHCIVIEMVGEAEVLY